MQHHAYDEMELLAALQAIVLLSIMLFFGMGDPRGPPPPHEAEIMIAIWDVKNSVANTGLFAAEEQQRGHGAPPPPWRTWAAINAKQRTIVSSHQIEWAWSILHGYPPLSCFEMGPLPAPAPKRLWEATDETSWQRLYARWRRQWPEDDDGGGIFKMSEFLYSAPGVKLQRRAELWFGEADEFGMLLMAESKAVLGGMNLTISEDNADNF
jgi:hypothetical protein